MQASRRDLSDVLGGAACEVDSADGRPRAGISGTDLRTRSVLDEPGGSGADEELPHEVQEPEASTAAAAAGSSQAAGAKPLRACYRYGNYPRYYGYRVGHALEDPRLAVFREEWFAGKRGLDIGTNEGLIPLSLVVRFLTASFQGIDIDNDLVHKAKIKLQRLQQTAMAASAEAAQLSSGAAQAPDRAALARAASALGHVSFRRANFVEMKVPSAAFDVVLCLSVSKWIHINFGDEGLTHLFEKAFAGLAPSGVLILEPQPWSSYKQAFRKQKMPPQTVATFNGLQLRPEEFAGLLLKAGFERVEALAVPTAKGGFQRELLIAYKAAAAGEGAAAAGPAPPQQQH